VQAGEHLNGDVGYTIVRVRSGDTIADVSLHSTADVSMRSWLGRRMRFRGVSGGLYNSRKQRYQGIVYVRSLQDMTLTDSVAAPSVGESPPVPLASLFQFGRKMPSLVRTSGVVSFVHPKNGFYMQDGNSGMLVQPAHPVDLVPGDEVEVIGRPEWEGPGRSVLSGALVTTGGRTALLSAPYHLNDLELPATEALLTSWEGVVVGQSSDGWRETLTLRPVIRKDPDLATFDCTHYRYDEGPSLPSYETGSVLNVQGVLELGWSPSHFRPINAQMLVRSPQDISLIARPPWESRFPWLQIFGLFALVLIGALAWVRTLRRRVAAQTFDLRGAVVLAEAAKTAAETANKAKSDLLEAAPDGAVVVSKAGEIVLVNAQAERMFGHPREAMLHCSSSLLFPERLRSDHFSRVVAEFKTLTFGSAIELVALRADGTEFPAEIRASPLAAEEGELLFLAFRDVTKRKEEEERNKKLEIMAAEAEAANKAKSLFLSTMSHEIRTPMNAILGYAQLMARDPDLGAEAKAHLKVINRSGEHLLVMINDVLEMAKIEAGRMQVTPRTFDLRTLLRDLQAMFSLRAMAKLLQFELRVIGERVDHIVADEGKIRQVLINLLGNAIKFTERGRVSLLVSVTSLPYDGRLCLSAQVEDTGIGMTAEEQAEMFQPFSQGISGHRVRHGGTGLGLAISRAVAHSMDGSITVSSSPGAGSNFLFEVPVQRGTHEDLPEPSDNEGRVVAIMAEHAVPRVLIADDVHENRQ